MTAPYCFNAGALAGIVVGTALGTAVIFLILVATFLFMKWRRDKKGEGCFLYIFGTDF